MAELTFPASWEVIIACYLSTCCGVILTEFGLKVMPLYSLTRQPVFVSRVGEGGEGGGHGKKRRHSLKPVKALDI